MKAIKINVIKLTGLVLIALLCNSPLALAQQTGNTDIRPVMKITNQGKTKVNPMRLTNLKIDIKVMGQVAVTTLDMTFYNDNYSVMEGEFVFPLGEGQSVSRFALDINGSLREGVVVEKEKGRKTFEAIARRGVDPGLLEMTGANTFKARVYPLPVMGSRRVVIAYEQELTDKGTYDLYTLPLDLDKPVDKFSIHVEVLKSKVSFDSTNELATLSFKEWNDSYVADMEQANFTPDKQIAFDIPHTGNGLKVFTAAMQSAPDSSDFYLSMRPDIVKEKKTFPKNITLLWDNSGSAEKRNIKKELSLLDSYIHKLGTVTIELVSFNIRSEKPRTFEITGGNWEQLKTALNSMVNDGGTSFGNIDLTSFRTDEILIFSDGISDFGPGEPRLPEKPVYTVCSALTADHNFLEFLAQRSGGAHIDLTRETTDDALQLLTNSNYHFISAQVVSGNAVELYPSMPCQFENTFTLAGKMIGRQAIIRLNFGFGNRVAYSKEVKINAGNTADALLLRRLWAERKIRELSINASENEDEITHTGRKYGIVTPYTSLIVLETLNDYLRYDIFPPLDLRPEYFKEKEAVKAEKDEMARIHFEHVLKLSDEQSIWWKTSYPVPVPADTLQLGTPPPPPPPPPPPAEQGNASHHDSRNVSEPNQVAYMIVENVEVMAEEAPPAEFKDAKEMVRADIQINAWDPETPYLKVLQYASKGTEYNTYLKLKKEYGSTPSFYIDASDFFLKKGDNEIALVILSNLAELQLESPQLLRILGKKLLDMKRNDYAISVFENVLKLRGEEPQSFIDLGLAYAASGDDQKAVNTLYEVVKRQWDSRFPSIELIALNEINGIIDRNPKINHSFIDKRLIKRESVDIRVVLTWDTDNSDMDLWVTDPEHEKCFYQHKITRLGGKISDDFTGGYGPEEFMIRKAVHGTYNVQVNYYGTRSQAILAPVNLHLTFITNYGRPDQKSQEVTVRLEEKEDVIDVGRFTF